MDVVFNYTVSKYTIKKIKEGIELFDERRDQNEKLVKTFKSENRQVIAENPDIPVVPVVEDALTWFPLSKGMQGFVARIQKDKYESFIRDCEMMELFFSLDEEISGTTRTRTVRPMFSTLGRVKDSSSRMVIVNGGINPALFEYIEHQPLKVTPKGH